MDLAYITITLTQYGLDAELFDIFIIDDLDNLILFEQNVNRNTLLTGTYQIPQTSLGVYDRVRIQAKGNCDNFVDFQINCGPTPTPTITPTPTETPTVTPTETPTVTSTESFSYEFDNFVTKGATYESTVIKSKLIITRQINSVILVDDITETSSNGLGTGVPDTYIIELEALDINDQRVTTDVFLQITADLGIPEDFSSAVGYISQSFVFLNGSTYYIDCEVDYQGPI